VPTLFVQSESGTELGRVITNGDAQGSRDALNDALDSPAASGFSSFARKLGFFGHHSRSSSRDISHDSVVSANSNQHDDRASYTSGKSGACQNYPFPAEETHLMRIDGVWHRLRLFVGIFNCFVANTLKLTNSQTFAGFEAYGLRLLRRPCFLTS
jgi:hypothetical protein